MTDEEIIEACREQIKKEAEALLRVREQVDQSYAEACRAILECRGHVIITGLGKTGHVGRKLAASMASLGIPAFFVHSAESLHGDMGMITKDDLVILFSNSGRSQEILNMLAPLKMIGVKTVSVTRDQNSPLASGTDIKILCDAGPEIDHLGLAPTASSTAALAIGDALATVACRIKGFRKQDFALFHPGGALGRELLREYQERTTSL